MKPTCFSLALILLIGSVSPGATVGRDEAWPRFRGWNGDGLGAADIPAQWSEKDYSWKIELPGGGHSSPVVWKDSLYLTCFDDKASEELVVCVSATDGTIRWKRAFPMHAFNKHPDNSYATSTPAVDATHVFVCWSTPEALTLVALDHQGNVLWQKDLGPFVSQHGGGQSPMAFGDAVYLGDDNEGPESYLFGFKADSGDTLWKVPRGHSDKFSPSTPCIYEPKEGAPEIVFASKRHGLTALDPKDGRQMWELSSIFDSRPVGSPFVADGLIIGTCGDNGTGHGLVVAHPDDAGRSAAVQYDIHRSVPYVPTPIVKDHLIYYWTDNGLITCARLETGALVWKQRIDAHFYGSPVCAGDRMFCVSKDSEVLVLAPGDKFNLLARNKLDLEDASTSHPPMSTTPAIANGHMYIRTWSHLVSIGH